MKTQKQMKRDLIVLYILSFIVSIAPLLVCLIVNWNKYTTTPGDTVKLCLGGIILLFFVFLKVVGKLRLPRRIITFATLFIVVYLLQSVLDDLLLLSGMALLGEFLDTILFQNAIKSTKESISIEKTATATSTQVEEVIKKYIGRV